MKKIAFHILAALLMFGCTVLKTDTKPEYSTVETTSSKRAISIKTAPSLTLNQSPQDTITSKPQHTETINKQKIPAREYQKDKNVEYGLTGNKTKKMDTLPKQPGHTQKADSTVRDLPVKNKQRSVIDKSESLRDLRDRGDYKSIRCGISGHNKNGDYFYGEIEADQSGGNGYIYDKDGKGIYVNVYWTDKGELEGYDLDSNYYKLEVDKY